MLIMFVVSVSFEYFFNETILIAIINLKAKAKICKIEIMQE